MPATPRSRGKRRAKAAPVTAQTVRELALSLPDVQEGPSYGTPGFRIRGKLFARLHQDGESLVLKVEFDLRDFLMQADPATFYITDHYRGYPMVLVRLSTVRRDQLAELLEEACRTAAPKRQRPAKPQPASIQPDTPARRKARPAR